MTKSHEFFSIDENFKEKMKRVKNGILCLKKIQCMTIDFLI